MRNTFSSDFISLWLPSILGGLCLAALYVHHVAHQNVPGFVRISQPSNLRSVTVFSHDNCTNSLGFFCPFRLPKCAGKSTYYGKLMSGQWEVLSEQFALRSDGTWETIKIVAARKDSCEVARFR
jgi:hypothetical protein